MTAASSELLRMGNGTAEALFDVPFLEPERFRQMLARRVAAGGRVAALFAAAVEPPDTDMFVVIANDDDGVLELARTAMEGAAYPSLTPVCPEVHLFEREMFEQAGLRPEGHPWLKPVRFETPWIGAHAARTGERPRIGDIPYYAVSGADIHEVAVGPVHAGVIEPGHFRFQCHGECVLHLEISLGYQHRGVEQALIGGPSMRSIHHAETLAGDTTIGHATAYCTILEALGGAHGCPRGECLRGIALETERLANHIGDLGALAGDIGYLPTASFCGRLRGEALNMTAVLCGNRFGRGLVVPGGVAHDVDTARAEELLRRLSALERDVTIAADLLWDTQSVMARFEGTGTLTAADCRTMGLVGPAARASGLGRDVRTNHPAGIYSFFHIPVFTWDTGDVFGRAYVRWMEIQHSITFIREQLAFLPEGAVRTAVGAPAGQRVAVALVEGWRGEICHVAITDEAGRFARYKIVDPSFHNWAGLALAMRDQQISDFPLCNKSFNLSYCGHDL